jgi:hypothetical protein
MKKITLLVFIAVFSQYAGSQEIHVQQKNGLFQKEEDKKNFFSSGSQVRTKRGKPSLEFDNQNNDLRRSRVSP